MDCTVFNIVHSCNIWKQPCRTKTLMVIKTQKIIMIKNNNCSTPTCYITQPTICEITGSLYFISEFSHFSAGRNLTGPILLLGRKRWELLLLQDISSTGNRLGHISKESNNIKGFIFYLWLASTRGKFNLTVLWKKCRRMSLVPISAKNGSMDGWIMEAVSLSHPTGQLRICIINW